MNELPFDPDAIAREHGEAHLIPPDMPPVRPPVAGPSLVPSGDEAWDEKLSALFSTARELATQAPAKIPYLVHGLLAIGAITELAGKVKSAGKTTFALAIVRAIIDGRPFAGLATTRSRVVYLTEQGRESFLPALVRAGLSDSDALTILHWHRAAGAPWPAVVRAAVAKAKEVGARLLVVDTIGQWAGLHGDDENSAGAALAAVQPLQLAAAEGIAVLVVRQSRKAGGDVGDDGRGSSAFSGAVDVLLSLRRADGNQKRVRVLHGLSRFSETPDTVTLELTATGEYVALGDAATSAVALATRELLACAPKDPDSAMKLDELAKAANIRRATAEAAVNELVRDGSLIRSGAGKRGSPFVYCLPTTAGGNGEGAEAQPVPTSTYMRDEKPRMPGRPPTRGNGHLPHVVALPIEDQMRRPALEVFPSAFVEDDDATAGAS